MWERSWANLMMLSAAIPSFDKDEDEDEEIQVLDGVSASQLNALWG